MAKVGLHVEVSRMLAQLDSIMPKEMSLRDLSLDTIEQFRDSSLMAPTSDKDRPLDRRLNVRLTGVAPSDVDLANFLTKLTSVPIFVQVGLIKADDGRIELDGCDVTQLPMYQRSRLGIGYLPQEASIFRGLTVEQNIRAVLEVVEPDSRRRERDLDRAQSFEIAP